MICLIDQVFYNKGKILFAKTYFQYDKNSPIQEIGYLTREKLFKLVHESQETFRAKICKNVNDKYVGQTVATLALFNVDGEPYLCNSEYFHYRKEDMIEKSDSDFIAMNS